MTRFKTSAMMLGSDRGLALALGAVRALIDVGAGEVKIMRRDAPDTWRGPDGRKLKQPPRPAASYRAARRNAARGKP